MKRISKRHNPKRFVAVSLALALVTVTTKADAGWLARGIGVGGAGHGLQKTLEDAGSLLDKALGAVVRNDRDALASAVSGIGDLPKTTIIHSFPVLDATNALVERAKTARKKINRFVAGTRDKVVDARAALANVARSASHAEIFSGEPVRLSLVPQAVASSAPATPAGKPDPVAAWLATPGAKAKRGATWNSALNTPKQPQVAAYARGCWGVEIDATDRKQYNQFKTMLGRRLQAGGSPDCAETRTDYPDTLEKERERQVALEKEKERKQRQRQLALEEERKRQVALEEERERQAALERKRERRERQAELEEEREWQAEEWRRQEEAKRQVFENLRQSLEAYSQQIQQQYGVGTSSGSGSSSSREECRPGFYNEKSKFCHPGGYPSDFRPGGRLRLRD